ncbi:MAG: aromatic ring-hydroxylating dioxygenase subunit alpha [Rhodospirillaceae bacterium]|jgi:phenylpropionate dioxygenase-like ring-hydroxylating dioxygenase large terminal subunit
MHTSHFGPLIRDAWYVAAWSTEVTDRPVARKILGQDVVIFRDRQGGVGVLEDRCCHRAAPLSLGDVVEEGLQCGYHGMVFDKQGHCVLNPGEETTPAGMRVKQYKAVERQSFVWVWMGDPATADEAEIIDFPFHDQAADWPFRYERYHIDCNYMLLIDNLMDLSHLAYVHRATIGGAPARQATASMTVEPTETGVKFLRWVLDIAPAPTFVKAMNFKTNVDRWSDFEYVAPAAVLQWAGALEVGRNAQDDRNQDGAYSMRMFHAATPETENACHYFWSVANGYRQDDPDAATDLFNEIVPTFKEDIVMLEAQQSKLEREPKRGMMPREQDSAVNLARNAIERLSSERP